MNQKNKSDYNSPQGNKMTARIIPNMLLYERFRVKCCFMVKKKRPRTPNETLICNIK